MLGIWLLPFNINYQLKKSVVKKIVDYKPFWNISDTICANKPIKRW